MKLAELFPGKNDIKETEITGLSSDSRNIRPGYLYGALQTFTLDGNRYIESAVGNGAAAVLTNDISLRQKFPEVRFLESANPNKDFARAAALFYPRQPRNICAVTGTNGKTSIADFIRQAIFAAGNNAASMGTLGIIKNDQPPLVYPNTTPETVALHQRLDKLAGEGFDYVAMEASSHGICEYRLGGIRIKAAGFTNLTLDHLDYHKTMENYYKAKEMLFTELLDKDGTAVLNADSDVYERLEKACRESGKKVLSYGRHGQDIKLLSEEATDKGQILKIIFEGKTQELFIPLAGDFQAMNVLCALGLASVLTGEPEKMLAAMSSLKGAKGRLEYIGTTATGGTVYVDYAHTPDALENVIAAMRPHTRGRLHILFGCGGDRDNSKRPIMGKIAAEKADEVYVSDDNPRTENPEEIRRQIMTGCPDAHNISGREDAIKYAMAHLRDGDVLIVAGKGHETGQYIMGKVYPFSDQEVIRKYL